MQITRHLLTGWLLVCLAGCSGGMTTAPGKITASYTLASVDGISIPGNVMHGATEITISSGSFVFYDNDTCLSKTHFSAPNGRHFTREVRATVTATDGGIVMHWQGAGTTTGTIDGERFTMDNHGMIFVYRLLR